MVCPLRHSDGAAIIAVESILCAFAIAAVVLRIWARRLKGIRLQASDWVCIAGLFVSIGLMAASITNVAHALNVRVPDPEPTRPATPSQIAAIHRGAAFAGPAMTYKSLLTEMYLWTTSTSLVRISTALLFIKIFPVRKVAIFCWVVVALNTAYVLGTYVVALVICLPWQPGWLNNPPPLRCEMNRQRMFLGHGITNLVFDIVLVAMPMPLVWQLQLPTRRKLELVLVFAGGLLVCAVTLGRLIEIEMESIQKLTQNYVSVAVLTVIEPFLGIITCSLPVLRPIARKMAKCKKGKNDSNLDDDDNLEKINHTSTIGTHGKVLKASDPYAFPDPEDYHHGRLSNSTRDSEEGKMSLDLVLPPVAYESRTDVRRVPLPRALVKNRYL